MNFFLVIGVALALAMDAFAISVGISLSSEGVTKRQTFRLAFHFGFFQFMMPVIGWLAGQSILEYIQAVDHWVAFGLLLFIGARMIYESFRSREMIKKRKTDPSKGFSLFTLSVATSIDALAVGLSIAVLHEVILYPAAVIGIVAFLMTVLGIKSGPLLGRMIGKRAELLGGLILILVGIKILSGHT